MASQPCSPKSKSSDSLSLPPMFRGNRNSTDDTSQLDARVGQLKTSGLQLGLNTQNASYFTTTVMDPLLEDFNSGRLTKRELIAFFENTPSSGRLRALAEQIIKIADQLDVFQKVMGKRAFLDLNDSDNIPEDISSSE